MTKIAPSGEQWTITYAELSATVVEVGGGLRTFDGPDGPIVSGYDAAAKADAGRGQTLAPWPNRIRDGKYEFADKPQQLALTEPARGNASHGLVRWSTWECAELTKSLAVLRHRLHPQPGWDWTLDLELRYELSESGLRVTVRAENLSSAPAPFGYGAHPYLTAGERAVDELALTVPASTELTIDERLIPTGVAPVSAALDFRQERSLDGVQLDNAYTDLTGDKDIWRIAISRGGRRTTLWAEANKFPYAQVFTADSLPEVKRRRSGVAVEPMTCPANAFNSGDGLITLAPGEQWSGSWGISAG